MRKNTKVRLTAWLIGVLAAATLCGSHAWAQAPRPVRDETITRVDLAVGRSLPLSMATPIAKVSVATPEVADVVVVSEREVVINAQKQGETDAILWAVGGGRVHYRIVVHTPSDRPQIVLYVKFAEVRRSLLSEIGLSSRFGDGHTRVGTGDLRTDDAISGGAVTLNDPKFLTILTDLGTKNLLALLQAEESRGTARTLAEPNVMAANRDTASLLAGGELPIPVVQSFSGGSGGEAPRVTIQYREFGVKLQFVADVLNDSLVRLWVRPEVSSLDYGNAVEISGFRVPALRTRRVESTVDVRRDESLIISGLFDNEEERVKGGVPLLKDLPIIGDLFASRRFQNNQTELLLVVTPVITDPMRPRGIDALDLPPETQVPAAGELARPDRLKTPKLPTIRRTTRGTPPPVKQ